MRGTRGVELTLSQCGHPRMPCTIYCFVDMKRPPAGGRDLAEVETGAQMQPDRETHPVMEGEDSKGGGQMAGQEEDPGIVEPSPLFKKMSLVTSAVIFLYSAAFWIQVGVMPVSVTILLRKHASKGRVNACLECKMKQSILPKGSSWDLNLRPSKHQSCRHSYQ